MNSKKNSCRGNYMRKYGMFDKKEKLLENEKDLANEKLSSKPAKAAETTETDEAVVQKSLTKNRQTSESSIKNLILDSLEYL